MSELADPPSARWFVGLMSGTSVDGIDAALVSSDGQRLQRTGIASMTPYATRTHDGIQRAIALGGAMHEAPDLAARLDAEIADDQAEAVRRLLGGAPARRALAGARPTIGFHGQTVLHEPERGRSLQLGDPQRLADALGLEVIARFRDADLAAGGQGAPIAPVYQAALLDELAASGMKEAREAAAMLNLGGIANVGARIDGALYGFDCGPANALLDRAMRNDGAAPFDEGGERAARGTARRSLVDALLADRWFAQRGPRSLDREHFERSVALAAVDALPLDDALATLVAFSAEAIAHSLDELPRALRLLVASGGGQHNRALIDALRSALPACRVVTADEVGLPGDLIEAEAMAFLAARHQADLPITWPGTTGVPQPLGGGRRFRPRAT